MIPYFYQDEFATLFLGDCRDVLKYTSADCIITSPPYNAGKAYDTHDDDLDPSEYWNLMADVADLTYSIARPGAYAIWNVPLWSGNRERRQFMPDLFRIHIGATGWEFDSEIVWVKSGALEGANAGGAAWGNYPTSPTIRNGHEPLLVFRKPGGTPRKIDDVSWKEWAQFTVGVWPIHPETNQKDHPARFPVPLVHRLLKLYTARGETVCDPFAGSGTTAYAAKILGRKSVGADISSAYLTLASNRLRQEQLSFAP